MPDHVIKRVTEALNTHRKSIKGSSIVLLGVAYKPNIDDIRESPALEIMQRLVELGARLSYVDPYIPCLSLGGIEMKSKKFSPAVIGRADCVVVVTPHSNFDYGVVAKSADLVVDTRNALKGKRGRNIFRL